MRIADDAQATVELDGAFNAQAEKQISIARYYIGKRDYTGALNRLKIVVTQFSSSQQVAEALARLTEIFLALDLSPDAQTTTAVLSRKYPNSHWSTDTIDALKSAGLRPVENWQSWVSRSLP